MSQCCTDMLNNNNDHRIFSLVNYFWSMDIKRITLKELSKRKFFDAMILLKYCLKLMVERRMLIQVSTDPPTWIRNNEKVYTTVFQVEGFPEEEIPKLAKETERIFTVKLIPRLAKVIEKTFYESNKNLVTYFLENSDGEINFFDLEDKGFYSNNNVLLHSLQRMIDNKFITFRYDGETAAYKWVRNPEHLKGTGKRWNSKPHGRRQ